MSAAAAQGLPTPARGRDTAPTRVSTRPWIEHWLETCRDLSELKASHPMMDAVIDEIDGRMIRIGDHWLADFASCNYLGFDLDREIIDAIPAYLDAWGTHPSWSRLLGSPVLYEEIEERLTALLGAEDTLVLPTITHIHMSVIPLLAASGTIFLDARAHKTIYDGCQVARARGAAVKRFRFEDPDHLDELLRAERDRTRLVCMDGVNSMTGNAPDIRAFAAVAREHGALLYVDDAHGFGVIGERSPDETVRSTAAAATASCATAARATTTSCSSAASRRPTRRCWPSSPARPTSRTCSRSPRRPTCTRARRRWPRWPPCSPASTSTSARGDELRRVLCERTARVLDCLAPPRRPHAQPLGLPDRRDPAARPRPHRRRRPLLFDRGVYVTLAAYPLVPQGRGRLPRAAHRRQHRRRGRHADRRARGARRSRRAAAARSAGAAAGGGGMSHARRLRLRRLAAVAALPGRRRAAVARSTCACRRSQASGPVYQPARALARVAILVGVRRYQPASRGPWICSRSGLALFWLGDLYTYSYPQLLGARRAVPVARRRRSTWPSTRR